MMLKVRTVITLEEIITERGPKDDSAWKYPLFVWGISHIGMPALLKFIKLYTYLPFKVLFCMNTALLKKGFLILKIQSRSE